MKSLGLQIRGARVRQGRSQQAVATEARVGRTTLIALERSKDVQLSTAVQVVTALGKQLVLQEGNELERALRLQARAEQNSRVSAARERHMRIAFVLLRSASDALPILERARVQVHLWVDKKTCSDVYISRWHEVLGGSPKEAAERICLLMDDEWGPALLQNSPFVGVMV